MGIKTVGIVGAGTMGNGIAQVFAQAGFSVMLVDIAKPMLERARASIEKSLARFVEKDKLSAADRDATLARLTTTTAIDRLADADFIGLDVCLAILNVLHDGFGDPKYRPCPLLRRMVAAGLLGRKSGQGFYAY
jgi:3-hydroxybutyryl-CoA dehydrogenase